MSHHDDAARWRTNWQNEVDAVQTYRLLAEVEKQPASPSASAGSSARR